MAGSDTGSDNIPYVLVQVMITCREVKIETIR